MEQGRQGDRGIEGRDREIARYSDRGIDIFETRYRGYTYI